jgi:hypothetical protein
VPIVCQKSRPLFECSPTRPSELRRQAPSSACTCPGRVRRTTGSQASESRRTARWWWESRLLRRSSGPRPPARKASVSRVVRGLGEA